MAKLYPVICCNFIRKRCADNGFYGNRIFRKRSLRDSARRNIVQKENAHLISAYQLILSVLCSHGDSHAIRIGIGRKQQIRIFLLCQGKTLFHSLQNFRIRIRAGGKIAVRIFLFRYNRNIGDPELLKNTGYRLKPRSV